MSKRYVLFDCPIFNCIISNGSNSEGISNNLVTILFNKEKIKEALDNQKLYEWIGNMDDRKLRNTRLHYVVKEYEETKDYRSYRIIFEVYNDHLNIEPYLDKIKDYLINELCNGKGINGFNIRICSGYYLTFMI